MNKLEAYKLFSRFEDDVEDIRTMYRNLKSDLQDTPPAQVHATASKILSLINRLDFGKNQEYLDALEGFVGLADMVESDEKIREEAAEMKRELFPLAEAPKKEEKPVPTKKSKTESIRSRFAVVQKEAENMDIGVAIDDIKRLQRDVGGLDYAELPEEDYDDMVKMRNDLSKMLATYQGVEKSEKYGPYLKEPMVDLVVHYVTNGSRDIGEKKALRILDFVEDPERIDMFEPAIKRIIARKMTAKEFRSFYQSIVSMARDERKFESYSSYNERYDGICFV